MLRLGTPTKNIARHLSSLKLNPSSYFPLQIANKIAPYFTQIFSMRDGFLTLRVL